MINIHLALMILEAIAVLVLLLIIIDQTKIRRRHKAMCESVEAILAKLRADPFERIAKLHLRPGDRLVLFLRPGVDLEPDIVEKVRSIIEAWAGVQVAVLRYDYDLGLLRRDETGGCPNGVR